MDSFLAIIREDVLPVVLTTFLGILAAAIPIIGRKVLAWLEVKMKVSLTDSDRASLQSAFANAATKAMAQSQARRMKAALEYVKTSLPETIARNGLDDAALKTLIEPHIERALAAKPRAVRRAVKDTPTSDPAPAEPDAPAT